MGDYYKLKLNCARTRVNNDMSEEDGLIRIGIQECGKVKGGEAPVETYSFSLDYLIAKKNGEYFEELFFGLPIGYDPNGIKIGIESSRSKGYDPNDLRKELARGITCFEYTKVKPKEVKEFLKSVQYSGATMKNYRDELKFVEGKKVIHIMLREQEEEKTGISRVRGNIHK